MSPLAYNEDMSTEGQPSKHSYLERHQEVKLQRMFKLFYLVLTKESLTMDQIISELGVGLRTVQRYIAQLQAAGVQIQPTKHNGPGAEWYILNADELKKQILKKSLKIKTAL